MAMMITYVLTMMNIHIDYNSLSHCPHGNLYVVPQAVLSFTLFFTCGITG